MYTMLQLMFSPNYKPVSQCIQVHYQDCGHFASAKAGDKAQSSVVQRWMSSIFEMTTCVCTAPQLNAYASFHTRLIFRPSFVALICLQLTIFLWNRGKYSAAVHRDWKEQLCIHTKRSQQQTISTFSEGNPQQSILIGLCVGNVKQIQLLLWRLFRF